MAGGTVHFVTDGTEAAIEPDRVPASPTATHSRYRAVR
jgi:hypothetical protein